MASQNVLELTTDTFDAATANGVALVDCWATWCGPCRMMAPIIDQIADDNAGTVTVAKVDVDQNPDIAARFGISSIPALLLFKDGQLSGKLIGARPKAEVQRQIDALK